MPRTCATARPQLAKADTAFASVGQPTEPCLEIQQIVLRLLVLPVAGLGLPSMRDSNERTPADGSAGLIAHSATLD